VYGLGLACQFFFPDFEGQEFALQEWLFADLRGSVRC
jgi:hypothetical protein